MAVDERELAKPVADPADLRPRAGWARHADVLAPSPVHASRTGISGLRRRSHRRACTEPPCYKVHAVWTCTICPGSSAGPIVGDRHLLRNHPRVLTLLTRADIAVLAISVT